VTRKNKRMMMNSMIRICWRYWRVIVQIESCSNIAESRLPRRMKI